MKKAVASSLVVCTLLSGCATDGSMEKKDLGTVIGGVAGVVAGSFFGKGSGRYVAMAVGGLAGAYLGRQFGAMLDEEDRKAVDVKAGQALASSGDGQTVSWSNPEKGVTAEITPSATRTESREVALLRKKEVAPIPALDLIGETYAARKGANVRAAPTTDAAVTAGLKAGETFDAVGKVRGSEWLVVARGRRTIGYVHASLVEPAGAAVQTQQAQAGLRPAADLDALAGAEGVDLDAEGLVAEKVAATSTCRTLDYKVSAKGETATEQHTACKSTDGAWEIL